jgi:hypothetical protein
MGEHLALIDDRAPKPDRRRSTGAPVFSAAFDLLIEQMKLETLSDPIAGGSD